MVSYNSDESNSDRNAFVGIPLIGPPQSPEKRWMLQGGVEEETKKKAGERKKSPVEERIETVKFTETNAGVKRTREMRVPMKKPHHMQAPSRNSLLMHA